ncbi:MAG TPA: DUF4136 domain-containing protein [Steroidobacteraceae bacterium]|nr:DUF4136 domain-containing protein [Steroidobacteraceae bacterium]
MSRFAKICLAVAGLSLSLGACATLQVTTDVNPQYSVANCHSYTFASERFGNPNAPYGNPLNSERLRSAVESNLAARGIMKASNPAAADCVVGYAMGTRPVFNDYYAGWGWGYGWGPGPWGYWGYDGPWVENQTRIVVDIFDARSHKPIWHAAVRQSADYLRGPQAEANINNAVAAIFAKLPSGAPAPGGRPS